MVSQAAASASDDDTNAISRSLACKKSHGKVPKRINKAEREKLKRDHMNVLFLELSKALEPAHENNGKASILNDTIRLLRELLTQVDGLKKENTSLLSESHYVTIEKNELREENLTLEGQIKKLQDEIEERVHPHSSDMDVSQSQKDHFQLPFIGHTAQPASALGPLVVFPLHHHDPEVCPAAADKEPDPKLATTLSRPRPRYPSPSDSWPSHILYDTPRCN